jgi:hypothetical protein
MNIKTKNLIVINMRNEAKVNWVLAIVSQDHFFITKVDGFVIQLKLKVLVIVLLQFEMTKLLTLLFLFLYFSVEMKMK